jgi:hypothetical protein
MRRSGCKEGYVEVKGKCIKGIKWGFDLTDFGSSKNFKKIVNKHKLVSRRQKIDTNYYNYIWEGHNLKMVTANNPITGAFSHPKYREPDVGYASYIGIQGKEKNVRDLVKDIKKNASIKDESKLERDFI